MKKAAVLIFLSVIFLNCGHSLDQTMRGVWVSSVYNLDYPSAPGLSREQLEKEADEVILNTKKAGLTDIFFQVRPTCDSLYSSNIFPKSQYLGENCGDFDPLQYFIEKSKEHGLSVHAWINPYRITKGGFSSKEEALASLPESSPALKLSDSVVSHSDGNLYFDPASAEVKQLILDGVSEIIKKYDVKGIHLDDYFYPSADFNDEASYELLKQENETIEDFRRRQVTELIYSLYDTVKTENSDIQFGVSPFGVWANSSSLPEGSNTASSQSYFDHYADTRKWVQDKKLDYIMPQLYWNIGHEQADYKTLLEWWENTVKSTGVKLYTGLAAYRLSSDSNGGLIYDSAEIPKQISLNTSSSQCSGYCIFRYGMLTEISGLSEALKNSDTEESSPSAIYLPTAYEEFSWPYDSYIFFGSCSMPVSVNGQQITQSPEGYFSVSLPVNYGENEYIFAAGSEQKTIKIHRSYEEPAKTKTAEIDFQSGGDFFTVPLAFSEKYGGLTFTPLTSEVSAEYSEKLCITALKDYTNIYSAPSSEKGAAAYIMKGEKWHVSMSKGEFYYIEGLGWVKKENVKAVRGSNEGTVEEIVSAENGESLTIDIKYKGNLSPSLYMSDKSFVLAVDGLSSFPESEGSYLSNGETAVTSSGIVYTFTPLINFDISGYELINYDSYFRLIFYKKPVLSENADTPLSGISFLIDPGHGGDDSGALSCKNGVFEKDFNLAYAKLLGEKLTAMGASVSFTREDDTFITLDDRFSKCMTERPDVFLSMHSNSMPLQSKNTDNKGISFYINSSFSSSFALSVKDSMTSDGFEITHIEEHSNLYMAKPKSCLSMLIENQYVISPESLALLESEEYKNQFCDSLIKAMSEYFSD